MLHNSSGQLVNITGCDALNSLAAAAPGGPRVLQLSVRFSF